MVLLESLDKSLGVVGRVVVYDIGRVVRVYLVDVFSELAARLGLDFLNFLETSALNECALSLEVLR